MSELAQETVDVLVVGGGMAGSFAAMAAAQRGLRVWIVEPSNVLGGQGTAGGVAGFCGDTARVNHLFDELVGRLTEHDLIQPCDPLADRRAYDLEWCAFFLQEMVVARGVKPLLHSRVIGARARDGRITEVTISTAGQTLTVQPQFVIDASGMCIVLHAAGFPVHHDGARRQLPMSLYFTLWDTGRPIKPILPQGVPTWQDDEAIPMTSLHPFASGKVEVKMKIIGFDAADGQSLAEAEIFARRQMMGLIYYLQTHGYRGVVLNRHVLASVSRHIGVREQHRLIGEHCLSDDEVQHGCVFDDAVAVGTYHLDYHWPDKLQRAGTGVTTMVEPYHLPLRCMIPKGASNCLVPGRGASAQQMALSSFRVMAVVAQMGFAAGVAAAQAVKDQTDVRRLDLPRLRQDIQAGGQSLDLSDYGDYLRQTILTREHVADAPGPVQRIWLAAGPDGRFTAAWQCGQLTHGAERFEGRWSRAEPGVIDDNARVLMIHQSDGRRVRLGATQDNRLCLQASDDAGDTWPYALRLTDACKAAPLATLAPTRRGVAVLFSDQQHRIHFWHGSFEHIIAGSVHKIPR